MLKPKRLLICLLAAILLFLPACGTQKSNSLRICFDMGHTADGMGGSSEQEKAAAGFVSELEAHAATIMPELVGNITVELVPSKPEQSTERAATLQRIRTEIMSGKGPDVFICAVECADPYGDNVDGTRLFPFVEQAMEDGRFLPLDDYLPSAQFMDWDDLYPTIMEGGRNSKGQQVVLPMGAMVPMTIYHKSDVDSYDMAGKTWADVESSTDPVLQAMVNWPWSVYPLDLQEDEIRYINEHNPRMSLTYPKLADFAEGRLAFTEEELLADVMSAVEAYRRAESGPAAMETLSAPMHALRESFEPTMSRFYLGFNNAIVDSDWTVLAVPDREGGVTAQATAWAAASADTKNPEGAFLALDLLLSTGLQKNSTLYRTYAYRADNYMMPTSKSIGAPGNAIYGMGRLMFTSQQYEQWVDAYDKVTGLRFLSPLDNELNNMMYEIQNYMGALTDTEGTKWPGERRQDFYQAEVTSQELGEIVHEYYARMQRLLDET